MRKLTPSQESALKQLSDKGNLFLTGGAGTGKSTLIEQFRNTYPGPIQMVASTGAAALLVGGITFHRYFGIGILEGGVEKTVERALENKRLRSRLKKADTVIIDEVSMLGGRELRTAETIARKVRGNSTPWGGIRIIAVGDFSQLPPVSRNYGDAGPGQKDWAFLDLVWRMSDFKPIILKETIRTKDTQLLDALNLIRSGRITNQVIDFLKSRTMEPSPQWKGTRCFPRRDQAEIYNLRQLEGLPGEVATYATRYTGTAEKQLELKKNSPIPDQLQLKVNARVMFRQNDPEDRWVNGSLGTVTRLDPVKYPEKIWVELSNGVEVEVVPVDFTLLDQDDQPVASAKNFPLNLAWATTIHKSQGATIDRLHVDLRSAWEHGQAYVALSRVREAKHLTLEGFQHSSFVVDPEVASFYRGLEYDDED